MTKRVIVPSVAALIATGLLGTPAAHADHGATDLTVEEGTCGVVVVHAEWSGDTSQIDDAQLVVYTPDGVRTADIGTRITVVSDEDTTVRYRVWGGGDPDFDSPALDDPDALTGFLDGGGDPTTADAPGVAWHTVDIEACENEGEQLTSDPASTEAPSDEDQIPEGEQDDETEGEHNHLEGSADWVAGYEQAPEGTHPGQFCETDDAYRIYAYSDTSVIQCLYSEASDRHHWVELTDADEILERPEDDAASEDKDTPPEEKPADPDDNRGDEGGLPVTGSALTGLIAASLATLGGGGAAMWIARTRRTAVDNE